MKKKLIVRRKQLKKDENMLTRQAIINSSKSLQRSLDNSFGSDEVADNSPKSLSRKEIRRRRSTLKMGAVETDDSEQLVVQNKLKSRQGSFQIERDGEFSHRVVKNGTPGDPSEISVINH